MEAGTVAEKGKPGRSIRILDDEIKENEQALLRLLEQARKCVASSESSEDDIEVELPKHRTNAKKEKLSRKNKLQQTINKVRTKLDAEKDCRDARNKRKKGQPNKKSTSKKSKR